jgi:hypothetical protein
MMQRLKADHEVIKTDNEDHENRLTVLEEPYYRKIDTMRIYEEYHLPMFGDRLTKENKYEEIRYVLPREALTLATEEALERGLLTKLEIGTR